MATMKASELAEDIRTALNDKDEPYKWASPVLLRLIADGEQIVYERRPDAATTSAGAFTTLTPPASLASNMTLDSAWRRAIVAYVCMNALADKGGDRENLSRAQAYERILATELS